MESPRKKRKITTGESLLPNAASSTPRKSSQDVFMEVPSISGIEYHYSSLNVQNPMSLIQSDSENSFQEKTPRQKTALSDILDSTSNSSTDVTTYEYDDENLDYDAFFKTCKSFQLKGPVWQQYKPISSEEGLLYYQITTDSRNTPELAKWFVDYSKNRPVPAATYALFKLYFDCSGFQNFNLEKYFTFPPKFEIILKKLNNDEYINKLLKTKKFLFEDKAKLAKILRFGVYNFLQKFVLEAHEKKFLYEPPFIAFLKLLTCMSREALCIPLIYTAYVFVIKILTAICMVKERIFEMQTLARENKLLDNYMTALYNSFSNISYMTGHILSKLKVDCLIELHLWIQYSVKLFVDNFNCIEVLKQLLADQFPNVRLAALDLCIKIIQNDDLINYLKGVPMKSLGGLVWERVCDVNILVQLKAFEVITITVSKYLEAVDNKKGLEILTEAIYNEDYKLGSAAGKCLIEILNFEKDDDLARLLYLGKIAEKFHPNLKSLLVESCADHTKLLQNWSLFIETLCDPNIEGERKAPLSELLLESVQLVLKGRPSKVRMSSILDRSVYPANDESIADEVYPHLKRIIELHGKDDNIIIQSIFKIFIEIAPDSLSQQHCKVVNQLIQIFIKLFTVWDDSETLNAVLCYLSYVNQHLTVVDSTSIIEDLKKYVVDEFDKCFKSKNGRTLITAKKFSIVFKYFDLNDHIEWSKLLSSWTLIKSNEKFIEFTLAACHWSLIWRIRKLYASLGQAELIKEISLILEMLTQFFNNCFEIMRLEDHAIKFKAFERICETYITYSRELEDISRQIRNVEVLKPVISDDTLRCELMKTFEFSFDPSIPSDAARVRKYIRYIYLMGCLSIIPMDSLSVGFKLYDSNYESYGKILDTILLTIHEKDDNWIPYLLVNTLALLHEDILKKHGVVDIRSREAKKILSLSRRFHKFKNIMNSKIASKLLIYAVNYVSSTKLYDFLIYVRSFTDDLHLPKERKEIIEIVQQKIPASAKKDDSVLYFIQHLRKPKGTIETSIKQTKKRVKVVKKSVTPKPKAKGAKVKGKRLFKKHSSQSTVESATSDNISIHDTSSNDGEFVDLNDTY